MAYSIWDKQPQLVLPQVPFEFLGKLAESQKQDLDKVDERIGATKGLFSKLVAAPGHEDLATGLSSTYNDLLNNTYTKYKDNPLSREFNRELIGIAASFANDTDVQKVIKSKEFYDKYGATIWEHQNKKSVILAPGILNDQGGWEQNTQLYNPATFRITEANDFIKPIQEQIAIKKENKYKEQNVAIRKHTDGSPMLDAEGRVMYDTKETSAIWNDPNNRAEVSEAILNMVMDHSESKPGFLYLKAIAEKQFPGDEQAQKKYIKNLISTSGVGFDFHWVETTEGEKLGPKIEDGGSGKGTTKDPATMFASTTTQTLDYLTTSSGERILNAAQVDSELDNLDTQLLQKQGEILKEFPILANIPNAFIQDSQSGYKTIDVNNMPTSLDKTQAMRYNADLEFLQRRRDSFASLKSFFIQDFSYIDSSGQEIKLDPNKTLSEQFSTSDQTRGIILQELQFDRNDAGAALLISSNLLKPPNSTDKSLKGFSTIQINNQSVPNPFSQVLNKPILNGADLKEHILTVHKTKNPNFELNKESIEIQADKAALAFDQNLNETLIKTNPVYEKFSKEFNNYLTNTTYAEATAYIPDQKYIGELSAMALTAVNNRDYTRATWGGKNDAPLQTISPQSKIEIEKQFAEGKIPSSAYTIRRDLSTGLWALDVVVNDPDRSGKFTRIEIVNPGTQAALANLVSEMDPHYTQDYLYREKDFIGQLKSTNGRYSLVDNPLPNNTNEQIIVKTALKQHGNIKPGQYMFTLPEYGDKVFIAVNPFDALKFIERYNLVKNISGSNIDQEIATTLQTTTFGQNVQLVDSKYEGLGKRYFATPSERVRTVSTGK